MLDAKYINGLHFYRHHHIITYVCFEKIFLLKKNFYIFVLKSAMIQVKKRSWMIYFWTSRQLSLAWLCPLKSSFIKHWKSWHVKGKYIRLLKGISSWLRTLTDTSCQLSRYWCKHLVLLTIKLTSLPLISFEILFFFNKVRYMKLIISNILLHFPSSITKCKSGCLSAWNSQLIVPFYSILLHSCYHTLEIIYDMILFCYA